MDTLSNDVKQLSLPEQKTFDGQPFPIVLSPNTEKTDLNFWCSWVKSNANTIKNHLLQYGAIYFRHFPIQTAEDFDIFVKSFDYKNFPYIGGAAPRTSITGNVFTANEAPPEEKIPFHHEMAQVPNFPKVLFFNCQTAPVTGGQTSLTSSNTIYKEMVEREPDFVDKLEKVGVRYIRILPQDDDLASPIGRGWKSTYLTESKEEVEKKASELGTELEWLNDGCLKTTTKVLPAIRTDTRTGKKTWFNSIIAAYLGWQDVRNDRTKAVVFGDGSPMPESQMETLEQVFEDNVVDITWQKGDVMMVDNRQALHARRPFQPPRRVLACLCDE